MKIKPVQKSARRISMTDKSKTAKRMPEHRPSAAYKRALAAVASMGKPEKA